MFYGIHVDGIIYLEDGKFVHPEMFADLFLDFISQYDLNFGGSFHEEDLDLEDCPMAKAKKGMGFDAAAEQIAKEQNVSKERAAAILAAQTRKASPAAKAANPNLKKVLPAKKKK